MPFEHLTNSPAETKQLAARLLQQWHPGQVIALIGELGSGKTTFVQGLAEAMGVARSVRSPTFVVMNVYECKSPQPPLEKGGDSLLGHRSLVNGHRSLCRLVHLDAYRLSGVEEAKLRELDKYIGWPDSLTVIEWPERLGELVRADWEVRFSMGEGERERRISVLSCHPLDSARGDPESYRRVTSLPLTSFR